MYIQLSVTMRPDLVVGSQAHAPLSHSMVGVSGWEKGVWVVEGSEHIFMLDSHQVCVCGCVSVHVYSISIHTCSYMYSNNVYIFVLYRRFSTACFVHCGHPGLHLRFTANQYFNYSNTACSLIHSGN